MVAFTTMTSKGQLTIPKEIREQLDLATGTRFQVVVRNGEVVAIPRNKRLADLAGVLGKPPSGERLSIAQIDDAIGEAVALDDERITREWREGRK